MSRLIIYVIFLICLQCLPKVSSKVRFTKIECTCTNKESCEFEYCYLKAVNRTYRYIGLKTRINIKEYPVDNIFLNVDILKRANGWRPFLYNATFDACKLFEQRNNPLFNYFSSFIHNHSNINHKCPYTQDIYVEELSDASIEYTLRNLPVPNGEYAVLTKWYIKKALKAEVNVYASISN